MEASEGLGFNKASVKDHLMCMPVYGRTTVAR